MKIPLFRRLLWGSTVSTAATAANIVAAILIMPYLIRTLGDAWYGAWVFIGAALSYAVVLDMGVFAAAERYVSAAFAKRDADAANRVLATCFWFYGLIGAGVGAAIAGVALAAPAYIENAALAREVRLALLIGGADMALFFVSGAFNGVIVAKYRYDIAGLFSLIKITGRTAAIFLIVRAGPGLVELAAITFAFNLAERLARAGLAYSLFPAIDLRPRSGSLGEWKELVRFGMKSFLIETAEKVRRQIDIVIIGAALGPAAIVRYNIAVRIASYLAQFGLGALQATLPLFSAHAARATRRVLRRDFALASRLAALGGAFAAGAAMLFVAPVIGLWIGADYMGAALFFYVLAPPLALELAQAPAINLMVARNRHGVVAALDWSEAAANLGLSLILLQIYGPLGVAIGTAIPMTIARGLVLPALVARHNGLGLGRVFANSTGAALFAAAIQAPVFFVMHSAPAATAPFAARLALAAGAYLALVIVAFFVSFSPRERKSLKRGLLGR